MAGLLGDLEQRILNPLFLGGASLLGGEGMSGAMRGMQTGGAFQDRKRQMDEETQRKQAFEGLLADPARLGNIPGGVMDIARVAGPEKGLGLLAGAMPEQVTDLERRYKEAQINSLNRKAADDGAAYGKTGSIFQDPASGQFFSVQFGADGSRKIEPLQANGQNITPARGVAVEGNVMYDKSTGNTVRDVSGAVAGGEQAKAVGKAQGEGQANWPKVVNAYRNYENKATRLEATIDRAISRIGPWTTGPGALLSSIPGTEAKALEGDLNTIRANVGFEELNALRDSAPNGSSGLGQVTELENRLLQSVQASIDQLQGGENVAQNLGIIKKSLKEMRALQKQKFEADAQRFGAQQQGQAAPSPGPGNFVWNPETRKLEPR